MLTNSMHTNGFCTNIRGYKMKRIIPIFIVAFMLFTGCSSINSQDASKVTNTGAQQSKTVFFLAGKIDAAQKADITTKIPAKVLSVAVDIGSVVKKGDPIIMLDTKDLEAQVAQAQAVVNTALANLTKTQNGARPEQISQAQAALDSAKTSYTNAKNSYNRNKQLFDNGGISQSQLDQAVTQLAAAQAQYNSATEALNILNSGETQSTLNVLDSQVKQSQAALELVKTQLANGTILSPVSGIVSAKNINIGELASPGVILVSVVDVNALIINASLPTGLIGEVKVGQSVAVKVSEIPDKEFQGEVYIVDPVIDSRSRSVLVKIRLNNSDSVLKPGMFAEIGLKK